MKLSIFSKNGKEKVFLFSLIFIFLSIFPLLAAEGEENSGVKFLENPNAISCVSPVMVVFRHEDVTSSVAQGRYGEMVAKSIFKKYAVTPGVDVDYFEPNNAKGNGYDFVVIDHAQKVVIILEAKSTEEKESATYNMTMRCAKTNSLSDMEVGSTKAVYDRLGSKLSGLLKKGGGTLHQLSRVWCFSCVDHGVGLFTSKPHRKTFRTFREAFVEYLGRESYKFMRLGSLTHVEKTEGIPVMPSTTYYSLIVDEKSKEQETGDQLARHSFVNGGLTTLFRDDQELEIEKSTEYIRTICEKMKSYRYPVEFVGSSSILEPFPFCGMPCPENVGAPESPKMPKPRLKTKKVVDDNGDSKKSKVRSLSEETQQEEKNEERVPYGVGLELTMAENVPVDYEVVEKCQEDALKKRKVSDNSGSDDNEWKRPKMASEVVSEITPVKSNVPGLTDVLDKFVKEKRDLEATINELKKIRDEKKSTNRRIALVLTKALEPEDLSGEDKKYIRSYHGVINLQEIYDGLRTADNKKAYIQEILEKLKRTKVISEDPVSTQTS